VGLVRQSGRICRAVAPSVLGVSSGQSPSSLISILEMGYPELVSGDKNESSRIRIELVTRSHIHIEKGHPLVRVIFFVA
ncbi:hypothetical protein, partial [Burkholderia multivorans]